MKTGELLENLKKIFGEIDEKVSFYFAPGRVNLIGEHTDYNGGYVFPCALSFGTYLAVRKNRLEKLRFASLNFEGVKEVPLSEIKNKQGNEWINYPLGVINEFYKLGIELPGYDFLYYGDLPNGAGLSSSASIEIVTAYAINDIYKIGLDVKELAKLGQRAENYFVGVNCGIMDQFSSVAGKKDHAIFLNCDTLEYELVPIVLGDYRLVIANTNKKRGLADSKYNERRSECERAVQIINKKRNIKLLGEITYDELINLKDLFINNEIEFRRARHVVSEIKRTVDAVDALKKGDLNKFGKLMNESHDSLRYDYEVTGLELDTLVDETRKVDGVVGSRMTGAGFGGCTVSIVHKDSINTLIEKVGKAYTDKTGLKADFYVAEIGDGAKKIE